jgi:hypothetical protein
MKSVQMWTVAVAVLAVRLAAQTPAARLWAISDGLRVNPVTGRVFEERADISHGLSGWRLARSEFRVDRPVEDRFAKSRAE